MMLPILFILMLPALIFGGLNSDDPTPIMNDNKSIYSNIEDINSRVYAVLDEAHKDILSEIDDEISYQEYDSEHEIIDTFDKHSAFDSTTLISQYCASKDDYKDIDLDDLVDIISSRKSELFSWSVVSSTKEITVTEMQDVAKIITEYVESVVIDEQGNKKTIKTPVEKEVTVKEEVTTTKTVTMYSYTVAFVGAEYFADKIFDLDDNKAEYARNLASNLTTFLDDKDNEDSQKNGSHQGIIDLIKDDTNGYDGGMFVDPVDGWKAHVTSEFGWRKDPKTGVQKFHNGLDIGVGIGTPVFAVADGTVLYAKKLNTGYGYHIVINHGGKVTTLYGHCSELLVSDGDTVHKGDVIAKSGSTGKSTGPHLHFEVCINGVGQNPRDYLP